ncbi:hypothetical protein Pve01_87010 [Planomonospora venezuelensis]|nr:hypothetical protein Pve01_87010 [Planomonospora venezuelensis]
MRPTEAARPSCTQSIEATAIDAPVRAAECEADECMTPVDGARTVRVHVILLDGSFVASTQ